MSPFLVYLLFQINSIIASLMIAGSILLIALMPLGYAAFRTADYSWDDKEAIKLHNVAARKWMRRCIAMAAVLLTACALLPSTKTIAAMIVLPKITSPQALDAMGKESRDIYELAKKALANLADDKPAKAETK